MEINKVDINTLNAAKYNPRKDLQPSDPEYVKLKNSIEHFGYVDPVIVNKRNNTVVGGHQRLKVLLDLGYKDIDVVYVDLDETDEKALNIALNKISGDWDAEKLEDILRDICIDENYDIELTGFTLDEVEKLFDGSLEEAVKDLEDTDKESEQKDKKKAIYIKIGDGIKIEITGAQYDIVSSLTPVEIVNRLTEKKVKEVHYNE
jgi:ParB-like chromosome segregation protein Spo0J